jgi:hypothetical protein
MRLWRTLMAALAVLTAGCGTANTEADSPSTSVLITTTTAVAVSSTTTSSTITSPTTTTLPAPPLVLRGDGLGVVILDSPMEEVLDTLIEHLGPPSSDHVQESPFGNEDYVPTKIGACNSATGYACFDYIRWVHWDAVGLFATFADVTVNETATPGDDDYYLQAAPNMTGYSYSGGTAGALLTTAEGISVGSSAADLGETYGEALAFS